MKTPDFLKKIDFGKVQTIIIIAVIILIIWVLVEFGGDFEAAINSVLTGLGLQKPAVQTTAEGAIQATSQSASNPSSPWSPALYNSNPDASTLDYQTLTNMADSIANTVEFSPLNWLMTPDASAALAIFKQCNNKIDVSNLVVVFQQFYNQDLYTWLEMNYTSAANEVILNQIITFVNNLPAT